MFADGRRPREQQPASHHAPAFAAEDPCAPGIDLEVEGTVTKNPAAALPRSGPEAGKLVGCDPGARADVELGVASRPARVQTDSKQHGRAGRKHFFGSPTTVERSLVPGTVTCGARHRPLGYGTDRRRRPLCRPGRPEPGGQRGEDERGPGTVGHRCPQPTPPGHFRPLPPSRRARGPSPGGRRTSRTSSITRSSEVLQSSRTIPNARRTAAQSSTPFAGRPALAG